MLRVIIGLFFLASCSMGEVKKGGEGAYSYDPVKDYTSEELKRLSPELVTTAHRDPPVGTLEKLFGKDQKPLKRIGIIIFESVIQPTRSGLAGDDLVYLSEQGKQLITEKLHSIWNQAFMTITPELDYVSSASIKKSKSLHSFGTEVKDYVHGKRSSIAPDDIFFLEKGKKTPTATVINPRGMRDLSFLLVPATELMAGPKWSEHNKQFVNEVMKELKLDAVLIVKSDLSWSTARIDKHSGESFAEEINLGIEASTLVSLSDYRERAAKIKENNPPNVTLCYRDYETKIKIPAKFNIPDHEQNFEVIEKELLGPMIKAYADLAIMMVNRIDQDLRETH